MTPANKASKGVMAERGGFELGWAVSTVYRVRYGVPGMIMQRSTVFCGAGLPRQSEMLRSLARMNLVSTQHAVASDVLQRLAA